MPGNPILTAEQRRQMRDYIPSLSDRPPGFDLAAALDRIASIANGDGASLIGVEDAAGSFVGEDLEAVLAELWTAATVGGTDTITDAGGYFAVDTIDGAFDALSLQIGGLTDATFNFAESNVIPDNTAVYAALELLDLFVGDLASVANMEGASLVGIEDAAGLYAGANVEAALAEARSILAMETGIAAAVAAGTFAVVQSFHTLTHAGASENVTTVTGLGDGRIALVSLGNAANNVVFQSGIGNVFTPGGFDITLDVLTDLALLIGKGVNVIVLAVNAATLANGGGIAAALASNANGQGASRVAIEDAATYYAGIDVEAALVALGTQIGGLTDATFGFAENNVLADNDALYAALEKLDLKWGDLASVANTEGASLVGIEDPTFLIAATNVEGALVENRTAIDALEVLVTQGVTPADSPTFAGLLVNGDIVQAGGSKFMADAELAFLRANYHLLNGDYVAAVAQTGGIVVNYLPIAPGVVTTTTGVVTAGIDGVSNPTITTDALGFALADIIQISGSANDGENDGWYEVFNHALVGADNILTLRSTSSGVNDRVEAFTGDQLVANPGDVGMTITKVNVTVLRAGTDGAWEVGSGAVTPITYSDLLTALTGQPLDATLSALAGLDAVAGIVEQTGADAFTKRLFGVGAATSVPTRADADARYDAIGAAAAAQAASQPVDAGLTSLAALPTVADRVAYSTALDTWAETPLTGPGRDLIDDATVAAQRATLDLANSYVQIQDTVISAAQILLLDGGPITIVAAPAGGQIAVPVLIQLMLDFGTVAFDDAAAQGNLRIQYVGGDNIAIVEADGLIDAGADAHRVVVIDATSPQVIDPLAATAIQIDNDGGTFSGAGGDSVLRVRVHYRVMAIDLSV